MRRMLLFLILAVLWVAAPAAAQERVVCVEGCASSAVLEASSDTTADNTSTIATATSAIAAAVAASPDAQQAQTFPATGAPIYGRYDTTAPTAVADGQAAAVRVADTGELLTNSTLQAGTASIGEVTGANDLPVIACNQTAIIDTASSGNVQLVALSGSTVIYVCSYVITAEATVDVRLVRGTGSACATGETSISGTFAFSTTTGLLGVSRGSGLGRITGGTAGDAVCIELGGAVQINGEISYAQF